MSVKFSKNWLNWIAFIFLIPSIFLNIFLFQKVQTNEKGEQVLEVLDGDTILLENDVRVRLRHVDAPELKYCGGNQAKDLLTGLIKGKKVTVQEQIIDNYGRPMALIYQGNNLINQKMLESGWVRYHSDSTTKVDILKNTANLAKENSLGIYSPLCYQKVNPENPKCNIKGNIDKNSSARKYYLPGCAQYEFTIVEKDIGEDWFCTEKEAQKVGFIKAETCK